MADVRVTQVAREAAVEPVGTNAEVAHFYADIAVMPDSAVTITSQSVEVLRSLANVITINRTLLLNSQVLGATAAGPASDWLNLRRKKMIFFVTLTLRQAIDLGAGSIIQTLDLHLANHALNTTQNDIPANTEFIAVLSDKDIPPLKQELSDALYGIVLPTFGKIVINNQDGQFDPYLNWGWEGGKFVMQLTGDKNELDFEFAVTVFTGVMGKMSYSDNMISVEVLSRTQELTSKNIPSATFVGPNQEDVLSPICYGSVNNISPILRDAVNYTYRIAGHQIQAVEAVFDNGVTLGTSQYSVDLINGEFTLNQVPVGTITCNVQGKLINGVYSTLRGDFIYDMAISYGGLLAADINGASLQEFNTLVPGQSGIYITQQTAITEAMNLLLRPVLGFVFFSRAGLMTLGKFVPFSGSTDLSAVINLTSSNIFPLGDAESDAAAAGDVILPDQVNQLFASATLRYFKNWTIQKEAELGASGLVDPSTAAGIARRAYLGMEGLEAKKSLTGSTEGRNLYPTATDMEVLESYFTNRVDAEGAAQYFLTLFGVKRWLVNIKTSLISSQTILNNIVRLSYTIEDEPTGGVKARFFNGQLARIVGYEENYGDNSTIIKILV